MKRSFMRQPNDSNLWLLAGPRRGARSGFWKAAPMGAARKSWGPSPESQPPDQAGL